MIKFINDVIIKCDKCKKINKISKEDFDCDSYCDCEE